MQTQEIKGKLAKLLATENLLVEHRSVNTASFDVDNRILTLPKWDKASSTVYDLLVGHEVGHALYTPMWDGFDCPKDYVNVTEDARIEKLMKRRYTGLRKCFFNGYRELNDDDFFGIAEENIDSLKLIDRINLYFKIGVAEVVIPFNAEEKILVDKTANTETFDEAVKVAEEIWEYSKEQQQELENLADIPQSGGDGSSGLSESQSVNDEESGEEGGEEVMTHEEMLEEAQRRENENGAAPAGGDISSSDTQNNFDQQSQSLSRISYSRNVYVDIPTLDASDYVVDWNVIHNWIDNQKEGLDPDGFSWVDLEYRKFKKSVQKEVNYLVKEFECKKAAAAYARQQTSRTGVLNTSILHTYKHNDDLFKKVTIIPEGKNHGLLFILDWSGSMNTTLLSTLKQLMTLCMFCKKVQIPFEVYAFTNEWIGAERAMENQVGKFFPKLITERLIKNEVYVSKQYFRMMNIFSSRTNSKNWERQCLNIWREVYSLQYYVGYPSTIGMSLSGTPLNESILVMKSIIPGFKKTTGVSNVNVCILTDGESCGSMYGHESTYDDDKQMIFARRLDSTSVTLRDRNLGCTYNKLESWDEQTNVFIENLKETHPSVNIIGIRLLEGGSGLASFYRRYCNDSVDGLDKLYRDWKKTKSVVLPNPISYDALYVIAGKSSARSFTELDEESTLDIDAGSSKTQVRAAFKKLLKQKQNNKAILNHFISQIA
jgi:hypothetical protein